MVNKKRNKLIQIIKIIDDKIINHDFEIIFGILAGTGLVSIVGSLITLTVELIPQLENYFVLMYSIIYFFILIFTTLIYTKGWFRITYLTSSLILSLTGIYVKLFGTIL